MFKNSKNILINSIKANPKLLMQTKKYFVASKRQNTYFDINVDYIIKALIPEKMHLAAFLAFLNVGLFLYVNLPSWKKTWSEKRFEILRGVSYSVANLKNKDYIPLFASLMGSYRLDDLILETGILLTIGKRLEKLHGSPFILKMFVFSYYIGMMSSLFWVQSNYAKRDRYHVKTAHDRNFGHAQFHEYRFMSQHGVCMSLLYFWLFKSKSFLVIPFILAADLYIWGPYYAPGALTGLAAGLIL
jgi:hypothetical protein